MSQLAKTTELDCYHCGLSVSGSEQFCAEFNGVIQHFCCPACKTVAGIINESGLSSYYSHQIPSGIAAPSWSNKESFYVFDDKDFQEQFVTENRQGFLSCSLLIEGIHCVACVWLLEKYLSELSGVKQVHVTYNEQKATISWCSSEMSLSTIVHAITRLGYRAEPFSSNFQSEMRQRENHRALRQLGVAGIAMMQVGMFAIALYAGALQGIAQEYRDFMRWVSFLVATPVVFYSAKPFFVGAWRGLILKKPGMDFPVAIAIGLAYAASCRATFSGSGEVYFDSVTMFTFLLLGGRYMEMQARHYSGRVGADLNSILPSTVTRLSGSTKSNSGKAFTSTTGDFGIESIDSRVDRQVVPLFKIKKGDSLLIKPGQVIPADGKVIEGFSHVNEAQLTGEFMPVVKHKGDEVIAGSMNGDGSIAMKVDSTGANLKIRAISDLLAQAQLNKPKIALLADKYASYFVSAIVLLSAVTYIYWSFVDGGNHADRAFWIMLSVLVVSCPCALSLATPAALTFAGNRLRSLGILVTDAQVWEKLNTITDVVFDKTGTLTKGELSLTQVVPLANLAEHQCNEIAAALESYSSHPIANVFSTKTGIAVENVELQSGQGVQGIIDGETYRIGSSGYASKLYGRSSELMPGNGQWILLSSSKGPLCWFKLQDKLRTDAERLLESLKSNGYITHILSGDSSGEASDLADKLNIDYCVSGASPESKLKYLEKLHENGAKVLMLGDGINDVPVLAAADISIAMSNASSLAKTHADSIFLSSKLFAVNSLFELASRTRQVVKQNIIWALVYNLTAIPLAAMSLIPPYLAALGMSLSSLVVIFNAFRLQNYREGEDTVGVIQSSVIGVSHG